MVCECEFSHLDGEVGGGVSVLDRLVRPFYRHVSRASLCSFHMIIASKFLFFYKVKMIWVELIPNLQGICFLVKWMRGTYKCSNFTTIQFAYRHLQMIVPCSESYSKELDEFITLRNSLVAFYRTWYISCKDNYPLVPGSLVYGKRSRCVLWSFQQTIVNSKFFFNFNFFL